MEKRNEKASDIIAIQHAVISAKQRSSASLYYIIKDHPPIHQLLVGSMLGLSVRAPARSCVCVVFEFSAIQLVARLTTRTAAAS